MIIVLFITFGTIWFYMKISINLSKLSKHTNQCVRLGGYPYVEGATSNVTTKDVDTCWLEISNRIELSALAHAEYHIDNGTGKTPEYCGSRTLPSEADKL